MTNTIYFTLNAHKKCIGQYNFDPLLYYTNEGPTHSLYLDTPGTYVIRYVSGAICSFNIDTIINELSANNKYISKNQIYWNRYYETSALTSLGSYDITYFPTSTILLACFQCQFGTLPGFTDTGYKTKTLAQTFNSKYLNNLDLKYDYTDALTFSIQQAQNLIFWYTNIAEQSVQGSITYSIDQVKNSLQTVYLNDISIIGINKSNISEYSYQNYYLNTYKQNISNIEISKVQDAWIKDQENRNKVKSICDFNTIGYDNAYINNIIYTDTLNYNTQYSDIYYWQLIKKAESKYNFIGKFNKNSQNLLLYTGYYTIILINDQYKFTNNNIDSIPQSMNNFLKKEDLLGNTDYSFYIPSAGIFNFSFLKQCEIYLYLEKATIDQLNTYIKENKNNNAFITQYNQKILAELQKQVEQSTSSNILNIKKIIDYNENTYNYYMDVSQYIYEKEKIPVFYIYATQKIENNLSIGPYKTPSAASTSISTIFPQLSGNLSSYICENYDTTKYLEYYKIYQKII